MNAYPSMPLPSEVIDLALRRGLLEQWIRELLEEQMLPLLRLPDDSEAIARMEDEGGVAC